MSDRLFVFNPDCELAIANGSAYYTPPANIVKMSRDLAYLPAYLAAEGDYLLVDRLPGPEFLEEKEKLMGYACRLVTWEEIKEKVWKEIVPWGWSPAISYRLTQEIRKWESVRKDSYSRKTARQCLEKLLPLLPSPDLDIIPEICGTIEEIERKMLEGEYVVKAPWSSSGKGVLFVNRFLQVKEKEWLSGILKKQGYVMLERKLDKVCDFAMEFSVSSDRIEFIGWSVFRTGAKGEYRGNYIGSQKNIRKKLEHYVYAEYLDNLKEQLIKTLQDLFVPVYRGPLGVDLMIYRNKQGAYQVHPCVEINLRYNMGIVALDFSRKCMLAETEGWFQIEFFSKKGEAYQKHLERKKELPTVYKNNRIQSGYLNLTPVEENTSFIASVQIRSLTESDGIHGNY